MELYKTFLVLFDSTKLNPFIRKDSLKIKKIASDDREAPTDSESSSEKGEKAKGEVVVPVSGKIIIRRIYQDTKGNQCTTFD